MTLSSLTLPASSGKKSSSSSSAQLLSPKFTGCEKIAFSTSAASTTGALASDFFFFSPSLDFDFDAAFLTFFWSRAAKAFFVASAMVLKTAAKLEFLFLSPVDYRALRSSWI